MNGGIIEDGDFVESLHSRSCVFFLSLAYRYLLDTILKHYILIWLSNKPIIHYVFKLSLSDISWKPTNAKEAGARRSCEI
jgi:hypothetical protein